MTDVVPAIEATVTSDMGNPDGIPKKLSSTRSAMTPPDNARFWLGAIVDSSDDAIVGKDLNGIVTAWNRAAESMFGYAADEIIGRPITCIIPPERIAEEASILGRLRGGGKIAHFETERKRKDGGLFPVSISVSPIRDNHDRIIGVSKIARDLSDHDRREDKLRAANTELERLARHLVKERDLAKQADRAKSQFLGGMSHELRTPLSGVLGCAELLQIEGGLNERQAARVETMLTAGKHLLEMVTGMLDLSAIEARREKLQLVECDVQAIAAACLDLVRPVAEAKDLALSIAVTPGTRRQVATDPTRLRQVLFNLIDNAVKFTSRGAIELRLRALADVAMMRIEVADTGPGILADQRQRLFQDFERLDPTGIVAGAGLGLALSARLAALMGGLLGHDDNPGGGSVFWLELPSNTVAGSSPATAPASPASGAPDAKPISARGLSVLIADDIAMNRDIAGSFLRASGHNVVCAEGGAEAVAAVASTDFDLVLMDVRMPEMDGLEATRRIRKLDGPRGRVPIVALTAHAFAEQVEACRSAGMEGHVPKPFTQAILFGAVAAASTGRARSLSPVSMAADPGIAGIGAEFLVFDQNAFDSSARYLAPEAVATYLQTIAEHGEALLLGLHHANGLMHVGDELARAAHTLASCAGMLGFERLTVLRRRFDRALQSGTAEAPALADALALLSRPRSR
jgi:PAS domain S-box-containing protein